jgi:hypothetical protein
MRRSLSTGRCFCSRADSDSSAPVFFVPPRASRAPLGTVRVCSFAAARFGSYCRLPTTDSAADSSSDSSDGKRESVVGRGTHCQRLLVKLDVQVSPRTVSKYIPKRPMRRPRGDMRWSRFLRLHAQGIIACDFLVAVTATFRLLYVFVVIGHRSRRLIHCNVPAHPSASWTLQQLREAIGLHERYEYLLHDRDNIFAKHLDESIRKLGVKISILSSTPGSLDVIARVSIPVAHSSPQWRSLPVGAWPTVSSVA